MGSIIKLIIRLWSLIPASVKSLGLSLILDLIKKLSTPTQAPTAPQVPSNERPMDYEVEPVVERSLPSPTGDNLVDLIARFEGCKLKAYKDAAGIWTIGYGSTTYLDGSKVQPGDTITEQEARELLALTVDRFRHSVMSNAPKGLKKCQIDALTSFAYNLGPSYLFNSTLFKMIKKDPNDPQIAEQFLKYRHAGGKYLRGLLLRRLEEAKLYFSC